ncbi:tRNA1(Val) (adenine(37)-N6)-methyltransferase [Kaistella montana]|uniref:tRNA1(Val) (adenine(37)-N6)-methyltransferase n=1 Tax=Kaistella montana TaxID=1849733 RepID=A0ABW5KAR1_9FLAO|nr:methyltransferase [Kaistella montana]MCQ4036081.1 methyltransferase [Kaistella montana]
MKPFQFKEFEIRQSKNVFRVGTDGVLLGAICSVSEAKKALEIGTGTGLISLMIAQRNLNATILAIDIDPEAVKLANENFANSPFLERINAINQDLNSWETNEKFDFIFSNPPYFEENPSQKDILARQQTALSFRNLIEKSSKLLTENGLLSVIIPYDSVNDFMKICLENQLHLHRKINISGIKNAAAKRCVLEFGFNEINPDEYDFYIEKSPRKYSDEYLELTKYFHVFPKKTD